MKSACLAEEVDDNQQKYLGEEAEEFVGDAMVKEFVDPGEFFDRRKTPAEEHVRKFDKIG